MARQQGGKVIRLSQKTYDALRKKLKAKESWDAMLRRQFGLPSRKGKEQAKRTFWILEKAKLLFADEKEARGIAIVMAVKAGRKKPESPIKVTEEV